jgi:hypothetical protein
VVKKTKTSTFENKKINLMKDEGKKTAGDNYQKLLQA